VLVRIVADFTPLSSVGAVRYAYVLFLLALLGWTLLQLGTLPGIWLVSAGSALNLTVILANAGHMPVSAMSGYTPISGGGLYVAASAFSFAYIYMQLGIGWSFVYAIVAMLLARGILSIVRRSLIVRERITPETDVMQRTVETNRAIFWKRGLYLLLVPILYFAGAYVMFGLAPEDALIALPTFLGTALTQLLYLLFLLGANFVLF